MIPPKADKKTGGLNSILNCRKKGKDRVDSEVLNEDRP